MTFRNAITALTFASFVAGCSGSSQPTAVPQLSGSQTHSVLARTTVSVARTRIRVAAAPSQSERVSGWIDAAAFTDTAGHHRGQLLYVSDIPANSGGASGGIVRIYAAATPDATLHQIGEITGLDTPTRIAVDRFANVYVVQTDTGAPVLVFKRGATHPFRTLDTGGAIATSIAVTEHGTVYVGTASSAVPAQLLVYAPGATAPTSHIDASFGDGINDLMVDRNENVYYDYVVIDLGGFIGRFASGSSSPTNLGFPDSPLSSALLHDGGMVIEPLNASQFDRFAPGQTVVSATFPANFVQSFCLNRAQTALYGAGAGTITTYAFPSGTVIHTLTVGAGDMNFGLAVSPSPRAPRPF